MKTFLTAEWNNLIMITYAVDPKQLSPYLPKTLELDTIDDKAFVSIVAFEFNSVRVKGIKIPFHTNFPEINLRFYVKQGNKRGVVFIKEFVPKYLVALVANKIYNEPYQSIPMQAKTILSGNQIESEHQFKVNKNNFTASVLVKNKPYIPDESSIEHFFKEHPYGFGNEKNRNLVSYQVEHPVWEIYPIIDYNLNIDFGKIYGNQWTFLNFQKPYNVLFAKGSQVKVYDKF